MDQATAELRGSIVDELQQRIEDLNSQKHNVPQQWYDMLSQVSDTDDTDVVNTVSAWLADLPPLEYKAAEVSWDTYTLFAKDFIDKTTLAAMTMQLIGGDNAKMVQAIRDTVAIRDSSGTPLEAMVKLNAVKQNVAG